ncbi:DUF1150 domain-containing protein [Stappia sp. F7233]|uniref:DUF1150 domain-containing protein n=1 Tax=Stappia albiluteola TaxID=2758565 RepID=A0A839ABM5_9HYPH|nr:DUF1150 family protein [Stappia albiluteola]MBA5777013.1 DUF1150 domain-containing protein [Stappia albiluteola]
MTEHGTKPIMAPEAFQTLGAGHIAYVKAMASEDVNELFPNTPKLRKGMKLWVLLNADGTPIMLADSREAAVANAAENELQTVSLH